MAKFNAQKHWWIVVIVLAAVGIVADLTMDQLMPGYEALAYPIALGLTGVGFCWAYSVSKDRLWWAIIPGLALLTLLAAGLADLLFGTDPSNDWISVLVIGIGALIIAAVLKRKDARLVLLIVAMFAFLVGIAMAPMALPLKGILIAVEVLAFVVYAWRTRGVATK